MCYDIMAAKIICSFPFRDAKTKKSTRVILNKRPFIMKITGLPIGYNIIYPTYWRLESINNGPMEDWKINLNPRYFL
jgi:hypothetical protein